MAGTFREMLLGYYAILQRDQGKAQARYFAEKSSLDEVSAADPRCSSPTCVRSCWCAIPGTCSAPGAPFGRAGRAFPKAAIAGLRDTSTVRAPDSEITHREPGHSPLRGSRPKTGRGAGSVWEYLDLDHPPAIDPDAEGAMFSGTALQVTHVNHWTLAPRDGVGGDCDSRAGVGVLYRAVELPPA